MNDFHSLNALHWNCSRQQAKVASFSYLWSDYSPRFLNWVHPDNRATLLARRGIVLGEN